MLAASCAGTAVRSEAGPRLTALSVRVTLGGAGPLTPPFSPDIGRYRLEAASTTAEVEFVPSAPAGVTFFTSATR